MIFNFPQNWRTSLLPYSLALMNRVNTGGSFTTPSGAIANSKIWASAGFRGFGPVMTFPGAGMDGLGCGCGCGGAGGCGGGGSNLLLWAFAGLGIYCLLEPVFTRQGTAYGD